MKRNTFFKTLLGAVCAVPLLPILVKITGTTESGCYEYESVFNGIRCKQTGIIKTV